MHDTIQLIANNEVNDAEDIVMEKSAELTGGTFTGSPEAGVTDLRFRVAYYIVSHDDIPEDDTEILYNAGFIRNRRQDEVECGFGYLYVDNEKKIRLDRMADNNDDRLPATFETPDLEPAFYDRSTRESNIIANPIPNAGRFSTGLFKRVFGSSDRHFLTQPISVNLIVPAPIMNTRETRSITNVLLR